MDALTAIFSILYAFWPLVILFGLRAFFVKGRSFLEKVRLAAVRVFVAWVIWAFFMGFIYWQGRQPILIISAPLNDILFAVLGLISGGISIGFLIHRVRLNRVHLKDARTLEDLLALTPEQFEDLVAKLFQVYGHHVENVGGKSDHGVDLVVISNRGEKWIVQCKRYSGSVGEPILRDLFGTMLHEGAQRAYLMTTGEITGQAQVWAEGKPMILYDGDALVKMIQRVQKQSNQLNP